MLVEDAFDRLLAAVAPLSAEPVPVVESHGRVAAEDVRAPGPVPHFSRPAMDGYVCHDIDVCGASQDHPATLRLSGEVRMGEVPGAGPGSGEAWTITTGAAMPVRGDRVLPLETVRRIGDALRIEQPPGRKPHIAMPGEDIEAGVTLVCAGDLITPPAAGALAACGVEKVRTYRRPRVALVATGDELVEVGDGAAPLAPGQIFNSNAVTFAGLLRALGCEVEARGIVRDHVDEMRGTFESLREGSDMVLSTGGVSIGRYDAVHRTWLDLGAQRIVGRVDLKPGGPFFAGRIGATMAVGLSGTPVASLAAFHLLVRPLVARLAGRRHVQRPLCEGVLVEGFSRGADRTRALWARAEGTPTGRPGVRVLVGASTGSVASLLQANALVLLPPGTPPLPPGSRATVLLLDRDEDRDRLSIGRPVPGPAVIGIVGESGSGKTTVIVEMLRRLTADGLRVAAVKHAPHGFDLDRAGTDSARFVEARAGLVALAGPTEILIRLPTPAANPAGLLPMINELAERTWGTLPDVVLVEGFTHPSGTVIQVGPQKPGAAAGEVLAILPAASEARGEVLAQELGRALDTLRQRMRACR